MQLNYVDHVFILASPITGCISKKNSITKEKKKKHDKIVLLEKSKLNSI